MFLDIHSDIDMYVEKTKELKEILTTIKTLKNRNKNTDDLCKELFLIFKDEYFSKSEFNCFLNACDYTTAVVNDFELFKQLVFLYIDNREITNNTPREWIQAIIDKGSSRSKCSIGEIKLIEIAKKYNFKEVNNWKDFINNNRVIARFSKNNFDNNRIKKYLNIDLQFNTQNKMLDIIIKSGDKIVFIEAKHIKESGGNQDKQIKELIEIIKTKSKNKNIYFCAFLDGFYSNKLLENINDDIINNIDLINNPNNTKLINQKIDIITSLNKNKTSFWFNSKGYEEFIKYL